VILAPDSSRIPGMDRREFLKTSGGAIMAAGVSSVLGSCETSSPRKQPISVQSRPAGLRTGLVYDPVYKTHDPGPGHPESPRRCDAIIDALSKEEFKDRLVRIAPRAASDEEILLCHTPQYLGTVRRDIESGASSLSTGDTGVCRDSLKAALLAAGGVLAGVDEVVARKVRNAFCAVRPPGHHAAPGRGMGFCVFDNIAIGARYARKNHKIEKVLIVDWDVHHGNGTQEIFYEDGAVMYFSTHQWPHYPGTGRASETGKGPGAGLILNCPFPAGAGRKEILGAMEDKLVPAADRFKPELVMVSAGFDARVDDPLGGFRLSDQDFTDMTNLVMDIARRHAADRLVSVLEGGYNLTGLASACAAHVRALCS